MALETPVMSCPGAKAGSTVPIGTNWFKRWYSARGTGEKDGSAHCADCRGWERETKGGPGRGERGDTTVSVMKRAWGIGVVCVSRDLEDAGWDGGGAYLDTIGGG